MKQLFNKLSAFLVMLICMSATVQAEIVHHTVCQPTYRTIGFTQECWEQDGKFYFDEDCTDEIIGEDLAKIVVYAKFPSSPVTNVSEFTQSESNQDWDGLTLNWVAETTFESALMSSFSRTPHFVEYKISSENIANARLIWTKNKGGWNYGTFTIKIYVNDVEILLIDEYKDKYPRLAGVHVESVSDLKQGDILKFEVTQTMKASYTAKPLFLVSLEYTYDSFECIHNIPAGRAVCSKCGYIVEHEHVYPEGSIICSKCDFKDNIKRRDVCEPTSRTRGFTQVCWEDIETGRFYSDEACTQELTGEQLIETVVYKKFPACPIVRMGEYEPYGRNEDWEVTSDWSVETHYYNSYKNWSSVPRYVEFNAASENIADARLVWTRGYGSIDRGK